MDIASVVGLIGGILLVGLAVVTADGASLGAFIDGPSILMVFGGTLAAVLIASPFGAVLNLFRVCRQVFFNRRENIAKLIEQIVALAETARRRGLLALEDHVEELRHPLMASGIQMAVDGASPEILEDVLRAEMEAVANRHRAGKHVLEQTARLAPAFGMVGTLVGLVIMLCNVKAPDAIAPGMAVALITTLYGVLTANLICIPFAEKLAALSRHELVAMEVVIRGVLGIQSGDHPRLIEQRLLSFLPRSQRPRPGSEQRLRRAA